jgi:hypothetical protein
MIWEYEPQRVIKETFLFKGPYRRTISLNGVIKPHEIQLALFDVINASKYNDGLAQVQKLTHKTTGSVIWIVDNLSLEGAEEILKRFQKPFIEILKNSHVTVMSPEEYSAK